MQNKTRTNTELSLTMESTLNNRSTATELHCKIIHYPARKQHIKNIFQEKYALIILFILVVKMKPSVHAIRLILLF